MVASDTGQGTPGSVTYHNLLFGGNLDITTNGGSTSPGTPSLAQTTSSTTTLIDESATATVTVFLTIGSTGFTAPTAPPPVKVLTSISATVITGGSTNALSFNSYINSSNGQNATTGTTTASPQTLDITAPASGLENSTTFMLASLGSPYSMTERYQITLDPGSSITLSASTSLSPAVPEPSSLALAGIGALGLIGYGLRRRKALGA
jgi:hypothetical protein